MDIGGTNPHQQVSTGRTEGPGQTDQVGRTGDGLGGHQARVGDAPGRGIGHLLRSIGQGVKNAFKSIGNFLAKIGNMITGRANRTDGQPQVQQRARVQAPPPQPRGLTPQGAIDNAHSMLSAFGGIIETQTAPDSFRTLCLQCMTDDEGVRDTLEENLDNPDYSSENFTGIEDHPSDPSKFIAKFGEKELVLSNRVSSRAEFRGAILKQQLQDSSYGSLKELIDQNHFGPLDSLSLFASTPIREGIRSDTTDMSQEEKHQVRDAVSQMPFAQGRTLGEVMDLSFLD